MLTAAQVPRIVVLALANLRELHRHEPDACWIPPGKSPDQRWQVRLPDDDYATTAPRLVLALEHGIVPAGTVAMHSCDRPGCLNPGHIEIATQGANMADKAAKGRQPPPSPEQVAKWRAANTYDHLRDRANHPKNKAARGPDGHIWASAAEAAQELGLTRQAIAHRCRRRILGWSWA